MATLPDTYKGWSDTLFLRGRGGKKKVRTDLLLTKAADGALEFRYVGYRNRENQLLITLTPDDVYELHWEGQRYFPTYSNIFHLVTKVVTYRDMSRFKHYQEPMRVNINTGEGRWHRTEAGKWERTESMPFTDGLRFRHGVCLNPEIAVDFKRTLNRTKSLPWLRKTEVLAKVLRVGTRMQLLERDWKQECSFDDVNIDDPSAADAEIILRRGNAVGLYRHSFATPDVQQAALIRAAENGLADYREWLYTKHGCYEMLPVTYSTKQGDEQ